MSYALGARSKSRLVGVNPILVSVVERAIVLTEQDFSVVEGLRTFSRQQTLFNQGKSKTMNSRHLTGHAVDLIPFPFNGDVDKDGIPNIEDWDQYYPVAKAVKQAAKELKVDLDWGGDWKSFPDGPHYQLSWKAFPK